MDLTHLAWILGFITVTAIICITCLMKSILTQRFDKQLPERLERFKLDQFKDGVTSIKTLRINSTND